VIGGLQLLMLGVLGEYLWRTLDEARARPRFVVEASAGSRDDSVSLEHTFGAGAGPMHGDCGGPTSMTFGGHS
jgi:hypothetical protein